MNIMQYVSLAMDLYRCLASGLVMCWLVFQFRSPNGQGYGAWVILRGHRFERRVGVCHASYSAIIPFRSVSKFFVLMNVQCVGEIRIHWYFSLFAI